MQACITWRLRSVEAGPELLRKPTDRQPIESLDEIEEQLAELAVQADRCRRIGLFAKVCVGLGLLLLAWIAAGLSGRSPAILVYAAAAALGGIVLAGSNRRTWDQILGRMRELEQRRTELIDAMDLRPVSE